RALEQNRSEAEPSRIHFLNTGADTLRCRIYRVQVTSKNPDRPGPKGSFSIRLRSDKRAMVSM
ncbi:hypothetical protein HispidOSU_004893, partial [Sigmodon hispidus]